MANSDGGYIILGFDDNLNVLGSNGFDETRFHSVLSANNKISPFPKWNNINCKFRNKEVILIKINPLTSDKLIWVMMGKVKRFPTRNGSHTA